jgi:glycosyltransferase involved in cell wall biosynthesis
MPISVPPAVIRERYGIAPEAPLLLYVGRISREKNLAVIIPMMERLVQSRSDAMFLFVGDFDYRRALEAAAYASTVAGHIVFAGKLPREELGSIYASADLFVFPSMTDTQGLVLHEAAQAGLPIVMIDEAVTEVVRGSENGIIVKNQATALAAAAATILDDAVLRRHMSARSKEIAQGYSEAAQTAKLLRVIQEAIKKRANTHQ